MINNDCTVNVENLFIEYILINGDKLRAVNDITFKVPQGKRLAIVGPSGCGKSTLLKAMAGIISPLSGKILYGNIKASDAQKKNIFGFVPQKPGLLKWLTTFDNVALPIYIEKRSKTNIVDRVQNMLSLFGLTKFSDFKPNDLSGGMQSRTAIARALINEPDVLLLDECFGSLDALTRERLYTELSPMWHKMGTSIILITHSIIEAVYLSDEIIVLSDLPGSIVGKVIVDAEQPRKENFMDSSSFLQATKNIRMMLNI